MTEQLISFLERVKINPKAPLFDEAATKQAIILPLLNLLEWDTYDIDEVTPEFSVENRRVDYSLRLNNTNEVFLEVKKTGENLEKYEEQLLDYSFRQGVELAVLTNGITFWLYLPMEKGDWKSRKFYTIDIMKQEIHDVDQKFMDLLSKANVQTGKALQRAESIYKGKLKKKFLEEIFPKAWNRLISEPDSVLLDLLSETTEKLCGFKPEADDIMQFLKRYKSQILLSPEKEVILPPKHIVSPPSLGPEERGKITQNDLIPEIIKVLKEYGGKAHKGQVEEEIYQKFQNIFKESWYQRTVSHGIPRWKQYIAWAKEMAKRDGLIKRPEDSGRGYWELTENGEKMTLQTKWLV